MAVSVLTSVGPVSDDVVDAIADRIPKIKVGPGLDPESEMGPLITREHRDRVASYLDSGPAQGARVVTDGRQHTTYTDSPGFFLGAVAVGRRQDGHGRLPRRDLRAGPVGRPGETYDEAVRLVRDNPWGNGVAIFTRDGGAARQFIFDAEAGMVGVNVPIPVPVAYYSFGGWKSSLFGDHHMYGPEGVQFYTRAKVVTARWPDPATSSVDLGFPRTR